MKNAGGITMDNKTYQRKEIDRFTAQNSAYFDTVKEFSEQLEDMDIQEQIEWIENGSYGAGACLVLQRALKGLTPRCNKKARIGNVVLHTFYGKSFLKWNKLTPEARKKMDAAVLAWLESEHNFAMTLEV